MTNLANKLNKRRQVREKAVQAIFQLLDEKQETSSQDAIAFALEAGNDPDKGFDQVEDDYLYGLVAGVQEHRAAIDQEIGQHLSQDWTLDRIAKIDLAILRLAFYELIFEQTQDIPPKVAINEAIDLAKFFSDEKSRVFVSGVLLAYLNQVDPVQE